MAALRYRRIVLKLSGEALKGDRGHGLDGPATAAAAARVAELRRMGVQPAVVIGAGNLLRGGRQEGMEIDRLTGDYMGMLGTIINALALRAALDRLGVRARVLSAIPVPQTAEAYGAPAARRALEDGEVVLLAGGTGLPYFTTDTAAALRAAELSADALVKATKVDGVYSADPRKNPRAARFARLTFDEALRRNLQVMDGAAFALCREAGIPILVVDFSDPQSVRRAVRGGNAGTVIHR